MIFLGVFLIIAVLLAILFRQSWFQDWWNASIRDWEAFIHGHWGE